MQHTTHLPFPALVGMETAQQALILLAIEPRLKGVVIAAPAGTGKSSLARGIRDVLSNRDDEHAMPFVELPPSVDAENLLGGLDLEATLRTGELKMQRGVLERADGGMVYVDGINLLTDSTSNLLLSVLDNGQVNIEREGVSHTAQAQFGLIGSYDPAEGAPRKHLVDRIGMIASLQGQMNESQRRKVLEHNLQRDVESWNDDIDFVRGMILAAREQLPQVVISDEQIEQISVLALMYGVEGHRAEVFAVWAACASAASELRDTVNNDDIELALRLVILPRATQIPAPPPEEPPQQEQQPPEQSQQEQDNSQDEPPPPPESDDSEDDDEPENIAPPDELMPPPEEILEALEAELPQELDELPYLNLRRGATGSRGTTEGTRGRHIRSVAGSPSQGRIDIIGTLRSAAPFQNFRRSEHNKHRHILLTPSDIRIKRYRSKAGALFCFAVDASGSMALHRMRQAKGALHNLLEKAYVKRDKVSLIAFRGDKAELLLPPSQSVELARRELDVLPTGGGTPLASAILLAGDIAQQARMRGILQTVLVLLTDGRGNVPLVEGENPQEELQQLGHYVRELGMRVIVVDTKRNYLSKGEAKQLAEWLGADYAYLPNASAEAITEVVTAVRE